MNRRPTRHAPDFALRGGRDLRPPHADFDAGQRAPRAGVIWRAYHDRDLPTLLWRPPMWFSSWLTALRIPSQPQRSRPRKRQLDRRSPQMRRLLLEGLEDRRLLTFLPAVSYPTGVDSLGAVATADFNNDGQLDLAFASNKYDPD